MKVASESVKIGNAFERLIEYSAAVSGGLVELEHLPQSGAKFVGAGKAFPLRMPCDFIGTIRGGRGIYLDAKSTDEQNRVNLGCVKPHQRSFLVRMGASGAVAGIMVEARHKHLQLVMWLPWQLLSGMAASIAFDDERLVTVGTTRTTIDWKQIVEVEQ